MTKNKISIGYSVKIERMRKIVAAEQKKKEVAAKAAAKKP